MFDIKIAIVHEKIRLNLEEVFHTCQRVHVVYHDFLSNHCIREAVTAVPCEENHSKENKLLNSK